MVAQEKRNTKEEKQKIHYVKPTLVRKIFLVPPIELLKHYVHLYFAKIRQSKNKQTKKTKINT